METPPSPLNPNSPLPLYHQLAERLLEGIRSGDFPTGARLPSEPQLARAYGIGRPTVRQATEVLVRRRVVERKRGSGTFVVDTPDGADLLSLAGTLASFEKGGIEAETEMVWGPKRLEIEDEPENPFDGRTAVGFSRLSRVQGVPVLLEEIYADAERFPQVEGVDLSGRSLSQWIEQQYHMRPTSADQNFRVTPLDASRSALLGLSEGDAILMVKRTLHFEGARSAIHAVLYCRTDQLVFSQTLQGVGDE
jgi:GntR family transcriptional regulator